jgi:hypothetical protein
VTEVEFDIFPPGLRGLNRLATRLNALMVEKQIADWHLGRSSDRTQTQYRVLFENDDDAALAKSNRGGARRDMADDAGGVMRLWRPTCILTISRLDRS